MPPTGEKTPADFDLKDFRYRSDDVSGQRSLVATPGHEAMAAQTRRGCASSEHLIIPMSEPGRRTLRPVNDLGHHLPADRRRTPFNALKLLAHRFSVYLSIG
jgi:hypothetical protein